MVKIPLEDLMTENIHNRPFFYYEYEDGIVKKRSLRYSKFGKRGKYLNSRVRIIKDLNTSVYIRQTVRNRLVITVRQINQTDLFKERVKLNLAWILSKFIPRTKVMMYEKQCERFEESASILYSRLIDEGFKNIYYVISKDNAVLDQLDEKYKKHMIYRFSFKHYLLFFSAGALIGTESPGHAIELRNSNIHAVRRIYKGKFKYVFLQHGVMYMVSLDSAGRSFFRKDGGMPKNCKIVVSSEEEAKHFIELGGFDREDLYVTGLPKYDKNEYYENADRIVIMPTWRPWEFNMLRNDIYNAPYYKMIEEIIDAIPSKLKDKVILMPHPLTLDSLRASKLSKYILDEFVYDEVLKNTKLLITDYSSVAYDAFYRGGNVIFYWKEKDFCMEQYQGHLMLNEDNVFGEICYNTEELSKVIEPEYTSGQKEEYINKYRKIVEFNDNNNTNRLINLLKKDKII